MTFRILLLSFFTFSFMQGITQPVFQVGVTAATFKMSDLKGLNSEFTTIAGVQGKEVTSFPPYFGIDIVISYQVNKHHIGLTLSRNTTGSRVAYRDYSGHYSIDQLLAGRLLAAQYGISIFQTENNHWEVIPSLRLGTLASKLQIKSQFQIGNNSSSESENFISQSFFVSPGLEFRRYLTSFFFIAGDIRYLAEAPVNLKWTEDHNFLLLNQQNSPVAAQWSGLRLTVSAGIKIK